MQKIDKTADKILSAKYKAWLDNQEVKHDGGNRYYYDDVAMNLFKMPVGCLRLYGNVHLCP